MGRAPFRFGPLPSPRQRGTSRKAKRRKFGCHPAQQHAHNPQTTSTLAGSNNGAVGNLVPGKTTRPQPQPQPPLPLSWGRTVEHVAEQGSQAGIASVMAVLALPWSGSDSLSQQPDDSSTAAKQQAAQQQPLYNRRQPSQQPQRRQQQQQDEQQKPWEAPAGTTYVEVADLVSFDFTQLLNKEHLAVLVHPGWLQRAPRAVPPATGWPPGLGDASGRRQEDRGVQGVRLDANSACSEQELPGRAFTVAPLAMERLRCLPWASLCPRGFLCVWAPKQHLSGEECFVWDHR